MSLQFLSICMLGSFLAKCHFYLFSNHQWISLLQACLVSHSTVLCMGTHISIYVCTHLHTHTEKYRYTCIQINCCISQGVANTIAARTGYIHIVGRSISFSFLFLFSFFPTSLILMPISSFIRGELKYTFFILFVIFFRPLIPPFGYPFTTLKRS